MKKMPGGQQYMIKTKRKYSIDEVYEILTKASFNEKFGEPIELKKGFLEKNITVPGLGKWKNIIQTTKNAIMVSQIKEEGLIGSIVGHVTGGAFDNIKTIGMVAGLGGAKDNKEVLKILAEEIEKLVDVKTGGCYVATCVYGSYDCPEVWTLRRFRDNTLARNWFGQNFIRIYYFISPLIVDKFSNQLWFKFMSKHIIQTLVKKLWKLGVEQTFYYD